MSTDELINKIQDDLNMLMEPEWKSNRDYVLARVTAMSIALSALSAHRQAVALETINKTIFDGAMFVGDR